MGGLEMAGRSAAGPLIVALLDDNPVVRANAAEMLGWLQPIADLGERASAMDGLARLLTDPAPAVQIQAAWALGEMDTEPARLALNAAPTAPTAVRPVAPAPLVALPGAIADVAADYWPLATVVGLVIIVLLAMLAAVMFWKGPLPTSHLGHP